VKLSALIVTAAVAFAAASSALLGGSGAATGAPSANPQLRSAYLRLPHDRVVSERSTLLAARIRLVRADSVFIETDGTYAPLMLQSAGRIFVAVDGRRVTNESAIDWRESVDRVRHSFDAVGGPRLAAGTHTVSLIAEPLEGAFTVSASSNLSVLVHPSRQVVSRTLARARGPFQFDTYGTKGPDTPHSELLRAPVDGRRRTVVLASGSARRARHDGDAMIGIYSNGVHPGPYASLWTVNDICTCAETQGPLFTHAFLGAGKKKRKVVSLDATELPWWTSVGDNPASYWMQAGARLIALNGLRVAGYARALATGYADLAGTATDFWCLASDVGWPDCAATGTDVLVAEAAFRVHRGDSGVVLFAAKSRVQADSADTGGTVSMWMTIDGARKGSTGIQELRAPSSVSERTIASSYLSAAPERLRPGRHVVRLFARADGSFIHVSFVKDLPLVWFD